MVERTCVLFYFTPVVPPVCVAEVNPESDGHLVGFHAVEEHLDGKPELGLDLIVVRSGH